MSGLILQKQQTMRVAAGKIEPKELNTRPRHSSSASSCQWNIKNALHLIPMLETCFIVRQKGIHTCGVCVLSLFCHAERARPWKTRVCNNIHRAALSKHFAYSHTQGTLWRRHLHTKIFRVTSMERASINFHIFSESAGACFHRSGGVSIQSIR